MGWMIRLLSVCTLAFSAIGCAGSGNGDVVFHDEAIVFNGAPAPYAVYTPKNYDRSKSYPTVVFLHGLFEGGTNGRSMTQVGIGPAIQEHPERWNCIVLMPQTPSNWQKPESIELASAVMDDAAKKYGIDQRRIVITGLSNGGAGAWLLGAKYPGRFAGLAPLCAFTEYDAVPKLTTIPVWAIHNSSDWVVSSSGAKDMVERINKAGGNAKITLYGGLSHNCWDKAYSDPTVVAWLQSPTKN